MNYIASQPWQLSHHGAKNKLLIIHTRFNDAQLEVPCIPLLKNEVFAWEKKKTFFRWGSSCWRFNETSYQAIITVWSVLDLWNVVAHIVIFYDIFNPLCRKVIQDHVLLYGIIFNLFSLSPSLNKTSRFLVLYFPANQCSFVNAMENPPTSKVSHSGSIEPSPLSVPNAERGNHAWCL